MNPVDILVERLCRGLDAPPEAAAEVRARARQAALNYLDDLRAEEWRIVRGHKIGTEAPGHPGEGGREVLVVTEEWS